MTPTTRTGTSTGTVIALVVQFVAIATFGLLWHNSRRAETIEYASLMRDVNHLLAAQAQYSLQGETLIRIDERTKGLEQKVVKIERAVDALAKESRR